jgi:hypothetical protein
MGVAGIATLPKPYMRASVFLHMKDFLLPVTLKTATDAWTRVQSLEDTQGIVTFLEKIVDAIHEQE